MIRRRHVIVGPLVGLAAFAGLAGALPAMSQPGREVPVSASPVGMYSPAAPDKPRRVGALRFLGGLELESEDPAFGGLSGLAVAPEGGSALAVTDRGQWLALDFRVEDAVPRGLTRARMAPLLDPEGRALDGPFTDAEALLAEEDAVLLAFEGRHRLHRYPAVRPIAEPETAFAAKGALMRLPLAARRQPRNGGIEAMVRIGDGRLLLFSERAEDDRGRLAVWLWPGRGEGERLSFAAPTGFFPTDAAPLPGGDVLLLLRRFSPLTGVAAMVMRIEAKTIAPGAVLRGQELALLQPPLTVDNMEGLAIRRDAAGRLLLYMVSDDNFRSLQRTLLLVYALEETGAGAGE